MWEQPRTSGGEPSPREGHIAIRNGHSILIVGGCDVSRDVQKCYNDVWKLDTSRMLWTLLSASHPLFGAREQHTAHPISGGRVLVIGGQKLFAHDYQDVVMFETESCGGTPSCSGNGACINGSCSCNRNWVSHDCGEKDGCPLGCRGHGFCLSGVCHCLPGFFGETCYSGKLCPGSGYKGDCNGNGTCNSDGICECKREFRGSGCEQLTEPGRSRTGQPAGTPVTDSSELPGSPEPEAGIFGIPVSGLSMLTTNLTEMDEPPSVQRNISLSSGGAPDVINALEPQIPGMPRTDIPIPEAKIQPPHANMPTVDIRSPLPNPPSYEATMPYIPVGMKVVVGALSILAGGATVSLMYAVNQKRK
ncbi:EGF family domain-containing protein [Toxoplasma gondii VAND]|uniref:EGF family domain-containing protein n=1 Tax=Toxoplasma gondii VAND TaxID=933077 RepID=A0A086Q317_TOXGO|nr:EGF family domain-containing protein [Toxoplasma gondii VAND]